MTSVNGSQVCDAVPLASEPRRSANDDSTLSPNAAFASLEAQMGQIERGSFSRHLIEMDDLENLAIPPPLIAETIDRGSITLLAGNFGTYKSFLAFDWAACIASGRPWFGRDVSAAVPVLYVAAEGAFGFKKRYKAWRRSRREDLQGKMQLYAKSINLTDAAQVQELISHCQAFEIGFVVIDTLHKCMPGFDDSSSRDIGVILATVEQIMHATPAMSVLLVHHSGKDGTTVRGSSALEDGVDISYFATRAPNVPMQLERRKRKDGPLEDVHTLVFRKVDGTDSGVLDPWSLAYDSDIFADNASNDDRAMAAYMAHHAALDACTQAQFITTLVDLGIATRTPGYKIISRLVSNGKLQKRTKGRSTWLSLPTSPTISEGA